MKLKELYETYQNWIHIEDLRRVDIGLAIRLISKIYGTRVWLLLVGPSGDWKTEQINALQDPPDTKIMRQFTSKTLVNGNPRTPDLAPQLTNKTILIPDMAPILKLHPNEKAQVWAQLRDLYDGCAGKQSGMGKDVEYKDLNVTLIGASTPAIDKQILIHQDLGTRELIWRTEKAEKTKIMEKVFINEKAEANMRVELRKATKEFLADKKYDKDLELPQEIINEIQTQSLLLSVLRAPADVDHYTGELLQDVCPEAPTRILKQLKRIYIALKCLDEDYPDEWAIETIRHIVKSSSIKIRYDLLNLLMKETELTSTTKFAEKLKIGVKTSLKELNALWNLGLVIRISTEELRGNKIMEFCRWKINDQHEMYERLREIFKPVLLVEEEKIETDNGYGE